MQDFYKITSMNIIHNHEIAEKSFLLHHSNRKLPDYLRQASVEMLSVGSRPSTVALLMSQKSGKNYFIQRFV